MKTSVERFTRSLWLRRPAVLAVAGLLALSAGAVVAADAADAAGKTLAQSCAGCHGVLGLSTLPDAPNIAGQPAIYVVNQLRAFRSGERRHEMMNMIAKPLSDADIDNLAAWFASIRIEAKAP